MSVKSKRSVIRPITASGIGESKEKMMFVIGITGGIGSGKTSVADIFRSKGVRVLDADEISREVTGPGGAALPEICELFGKKSIDSDHSMNRKFIASLVFSNRKKLDLLSKTVHKYVLQKIAAELGLEREKGAKLIVLDVPIPVKKGFADICNQIWVISADESIRMDRLIARGMDADDARRRMDMQMTREEYEEMADIVIVNDNGKEDLLACVEKNIVEQLHERGIRI
ncbi:MAG: dephospho-CoA kinase [Clostridiaceae bacterium]|nr:dephospho-CoA kinase [Clostridiaceae bacterium]